MMTTLPTMMLLSLAAHAVGPSDSPWSTACAKVCERTGFKIEVLEHEDTGSAKLVLWDITAHEYIDDAHWQSGDVYLGDQSVADPLPGGPYCTSYPGAAGHFIDGNVYDRHIHYDWEYEETSTLFTSPMTYCDADFPFLLDTLELYGVGDGALPTSCTDLDCASGDGIDPEDPGTGGWGYTDAAGDEQSFDDLLDDGDDGGDGGIEPVVTEAGTVSRSR